MNRIFVENGHFTECPKMTVKMCDLHTLTQVNRDSNA